MKSNTLFALLIILSFIVGWNSAAEFGFMFIKFIASILIYLGGVMGGMELGYKVKEEEINDRK